MKKMVKNNKESSKNTEKTAKNNKETPKNTENKVKNNSLIPIFRGKKTLGESAADFITKWAGSWIFILGFFVFLGLWMAANIYAWINQWDPYPFILLNLVLSCLAAIQAPVILMSQNRQSQRDRIKAEFDYKVNRKAEREIQEVKKQLNRIERSIHKK
jgi:uncharacterized membrane protein